MKPQAYDNVQLKALEENFDRNIDAGTREHNIISRLLETIKARDAEILMLQAQVTDQGFWPTHHHNKRGSDYQFDGIGTVQTNGMKEGDQVAIYKDKDGNKHVRFLPEFADGRFSILPRNDLTQHEMLDADPLTREIHNVVHSAAALCAFIDMDWVDRVCEDDAQLHALFTDLGTDILTLEQEVHDRAEGQPITWAVQYTNALIAKLRGKARAADHTLNDLLAMARYNAHIERIINNRHLDAAQAKQDGPVQKVVIGMGTVSSEASQPSNGVKLL